MNRSLSSSAAFLVLLFAATGIHTVVAIPGSVEVNALYRTFPEQIEQISVREGEWALQLQGTWYRWAEGRLLSEAIRQDWNEYVPIRFYNYQLGRYTVPFVPPELEARFRASTANRGRDTRVRFNSFLDKLYGISSRQEAETLMQRVTFLDRSTRVHPRVVEPLQRVERRIRAASAADAETRDFLANLAEIHGYNWRLIAGTQRRSYHSYGMALDLVPRNYGGKWAYWQWAADSGVDAWWRLTAEERWQVPQPVIDAFEAEGFIWGGKWMFFDNIHFEYRPEVIEMARQPRAAG